MVSFTLFRCQSIDLTFVIRAVPQIFDASSYELVEPRTGHGVPGTAWQK